MSSRVTPLKKKRLSGTTLNTTTYCFTREKTILDFFLERIYKELGNNS